MQASDIRCSNDVALFEKLKSHNDVVRANKLIDRHEEQSANSIRRNLLSTSVRLTKAMAPDIVSMADECVERLGVELPLELYVYSSPQFNAACFKPENDRLYVMFSSSLLEGFNSEELRFVMGHELGHHVYNHHEIPIGYLLRGEQKPDPSLALELFAWSRYAEISADRAGAHCAQNMDAVATSLFKLSSGLTSKVVEFSLDDFVAQVDEMAVIDNDIDQKTVGQSTPKSDWFSTHPFSPLRVKALKLFENSELYSASGVSSHSKVELEVGVQSVLSLMEPSYLESKTDTAEIMRRLLFAGLIAVADASDDGITKPELDVFAKFFGKYAFSDKLDVQKIKQTVSSRAKEVASKASQTQCMQIMHDLCIIAKADGGVCDSERSLLVEIAATLGVDKAFVNQALVQVVDLD